jgi:hypothetical protein
MIGRDSTIANADCAVSRRARRLPMSTLIPRFPVAVIMRRTPLANRWASERWEPIAVLPRDADAGSDGAPVCLRDDAAGTEWRFDGHSIELHRSEAEGYFLNLDAPEPRVFVHWRESEGGAGPPVYPAIVTVSYNEAARLMDGGHQVDSVPLAEALLAWMLPFVAEHYKPEPKKKVRRNDPFADGAFRSERGRRG